MTAARSPARPRTDAGFGLPPGTSRVEVILTRTGEDADRTRLRLIHTAMAGDLGLLHDGWSRFLAGLTAAATRGEPGAYPAKQPGQRRTTLRRQHARKQLTKARASWPLTC